MADEVVAAVAETVAPARPKTRVKLMFSHLTNNQPKTKMARVGGCTFFRQVVTEGRGDEATTKVGWRHANLPIHKAHRKMCPHPEHWDFQATREPHPEISGLQSVTAVTYSPTMASEAIQEAIGQALALVPPNSGRHVTVEV